jgi:glycosyltransferase involved in cell wall biosynthesis
VTVLIPTLDRYRHLRKLLSQLRDQTIKPLEIIVVDQTPVERRDTILGDDFSDLPLTIIYLDHPGQCSSRNSGLKLAKGDHVLFLDDDDEISSTLLEAHLRNLLRFDADVSSGVADEVGAGPLPDEFQVLRISDVFPTNNTLIRRTALQDSGLFDLAYDHGSRADGDLGMRVYLSGALMVLNPEIRVLHHRANKGGLRTHGARVITYASSRRSLLQRHLPSATEIYLSKRYFTEMQVREMLWICAFSTFSIRGGIFRKILKAIISLILLPNTLHQIRKNYRTALRMHEDYPQIPTLTVRGASGA